MTEILEIALAYAARGWPVFPCHPGNKTPMVRAWRDTASADGAQVRAWWTRWPDALIGLPMGGPTGLFALDFDPRTDGATGEVWTLDRLKADVEALIGGPLPASWTCVTQSGGVHVFFAQPTDGPPIGNGRGRLRDPAAPVPHVDVRGLGGYVIAAGSVHGSGRRYRWLRAPDDTPLAAPPPALVDALRWQPPGGEADMGEAHPPRAPASGGARPDDAAEQAVRKYGLAALDNQVRRVEQAADGTRNQTLNDAALSLGHLVAAGALSEALVVSALEAVARGWPNFRKSQGTIKSGLTAGKRDAADLGPVIDKARARAGRRTSMAPDRASAAAPAPDPVSDDWNSPPAPAKPAAENAPAGGLAAVGVSVGSGYPGCRGEAERFDLDMACARFPLTDLGNKQRFLARFGRDFRWCKELGWLAWDTRRWLVEGEDKYAVLLLAACTRTVELIQAEAAAVVASREGHAEPEAALPGARWGDDFVVKITNNRPVWFSDTIRRHALASQSRDRIRGFAGLAACDLRVARDALDADPWALTVRNGTLRIKSGAALEAARATGAPYYWLDEHRREDLITHQATVDFVPGATCPGYDDFLARVQPDAAMRRFLHQWAGLKLTAKTGLRTFVWHYGPKGNNGKSTWAMALQAVLGDYARQISVETILNHGAGKSGSAPTPDLAELVGVRAVFCSEPREGAEVSDELIKDLTGGDLITCRTLFGPLFRFEMVGKISVNGNHQPKLKGKDDAIWGRLRVVPWTVSVAGEAGLKETDHFKALWTAEASGILNHMLDGLCDWLDNKLVSPDAVTEATAAHRDNLDVVARFLAACVQRVEPDHGRRVQATAMHELYSAWAKANGEPANSAKWLKGQLEIKGLSQVKASVVFWRDVHLLYRPSDFVDANGVVLSRDTPPVPSPFTPPGAGSGRIDPPTREDGGDPWDD